jgi:hypothetical protein
MRRTAVLAAGLLVAAASAGCARNIAPDGGPVPEAPPRVVSISPDSFAILAPFGGAVRIEFDRTLAERLTQGSIRDAVVVSPRTGEVEVRQRGNRVEISMEGGFRTPAVYRITLLPRFQDRYRNRLDRPVELFFSTGPDFDPTLVAGLVTDRLTGVDAPGIRVDAVPVGEGPTYSAVADSTGVFAFRYLPAGGYEIVAFDDMNRNREPDFTERQARTSVQIAAADTIVVTELSLLAPDTTAARLMTATARDTLHVELTFDDHLDPEWSPAGVRARLEPVEGADPEEVAALGPLPAVREVLHLDTWEARQAEAPPAAPPADPADPDAAPPEPAQEPEPDPEPEAADEAEIIRLPAQQLVAVLDGPLPRGVRLRIVVEGVVNLHGIPEGGGEAAFDTPPPEAPAETPPPDAEPPGSDPPDAAPPGAP